MFELFSNVCFGSTADVHSIPFERLVSARSSRSETQGSHFPAQRQNDSPKIIDAKPTTSPIPKTRNQPPSLFPPPVVPAAKDNTRITPTTNPQPNRLLLDSVCFSVIFHRYLSGRFRPQAAGQTYARFTSRALLLSDSTT